MNKMDYFQIQVMQVLGDLNGEHRTTRNGAEIDLQLQEIVRDFHDLTQLSEQD